MAIDYSSRILNKHNLNFITSFLLAIMSYQLILAPSAALALEDVKSAEAASQADQSDQPDEEKDVEEVKPEPEQYTITHTGVKGISAYNVGDPFQTDDSPCTAANGENICLALELGYKRCAANFVPFGTLLEIEGYGRCIVTDRMSSRFQNHVDIAYKKTEKKEALQFGRRKLVVKVLKKLETAAVGDKKKTVEI